MDKVLFPIYRILVPKPLRTIILKWTLRIKILNYFSHLPEEAVNEEQKEVLNYLEENPVSIFPYPFGHEYSPENVEVFTDPGNRMKYVIHEGKKLYFKKRWNKNRIRISYTELCKEQDIRSPHRYITDEFTPDKNDVVADIGAAEGNFSLSIIEKVKKIYLFETNREWTAALEFTFAPWKEKVEIIPEYVGDLDDEKHISLGTFFKTHPDITFLKIDVDGNEQRILDGSRPILEDTIHLKIALCTYHKNNDEADFTELLQKSGFKLTVSKGYMINYHDKKIKAPWLRRGLLKAIR